MKKAGFLVTLTILSSLTVFCQSTRRGLLEIAVGPTFPVGNFAKKDIGPSSGHAKAGQFASVSYSYLLGKRFGLTGTLLAQRNPINARAMGSSFGQLKIFDGIYSPSLPVQPNQSLYITYHNWQVEKGSWLMGTLLAGGYGLFPLSGDNKISLTTKAMIGVMYVKSPDVEAKTVTDTSIVQLQQGSKSSFGLAYLVSVGTKYNCTKRISLLVSLDFLGTPQMKFEDVRRTISTAELSAGLPAYSMQQTTAHQKQSIGSINARVGIGLAL